MINRNIFFTCRCSIQKGIFTLCLCCFLTKLPAQNTIDVLHYEFNITLSDKSDTIKASAYITFVAIETTKSVAFDLLNINKDKKGMLVSRAGFFTLDIPPSQFNHVSNKVVITPSIPLNPGDTATVVIEYKGIPDDGLIISRNRYGDRTFFADNWPNRANSWIPCVDDPGDKASFEFIVTAPSHYKVISNGLLVEEQLLPDNNKITHWKEDIPLPTKIMVIGAADFAIKRYADSPSGIPVTAWIFAKDSIDGFNDYDMAPTILKYFINYIGLYPYNKLANVQSKTIFGAMENASAIFYSENSVNGLHDQERLLAHEISHQWFGDMVTEKRFAHLWLSEGFADYLAHLYIESRYGTDSLETEMKTDREKVIQYARSVRNPVVDSVSSYKQLLNTNSYEKGSWVLHMLRRQLGDSVFHEIIRSYYSTYKGKNADTKDLQAIAEKKSGKNLDDFFRQWLYTPGIPQLLINWKYNSDEKKLIVSVEQTQSDGPFSFPLDISIVPEPGKSLMEKLTIDKKKEIFTLPVNTPPLEIIADPYTSLLYEGFVHQLK